MRFRVEIRPRACGRNPTLLVSKMELGADESNLYGLIAAIKRSSYLTLRLVPKSASPAALTLDHMDCLAAQRSPDHH